MTINEVNQWQDLIREYNKQPIPYEELKQKCREAGLEQINEYLINNNYIARMRDGNVFINWSSNKYHPEATIINLKAELNNETRPLTLEERVEILEEQLAQLLKKEAV